jgi:RNase P subunit RPR2
MEPESGTRTKLGRLNLEFLHGTGLVSNDYCLAPRLVREKKKFGFFLKNVVKRRTCNVCHLLLSEGKGYNTAGKKRHYGYGNRLYKTCFVLSQMKYSRASLIYNI